MRNSLLFALIISVLSACGDDGGGAADHGKGQSNERIHAYCVANCKRNDECEVNALVEGDECVTVCEGFTIAYGNCDPTEAVVQACIAAIEKNSCEAQKNDDEPEACAALCEE